jgi:hypothetical protein
MQKQAATLDLAERKRLFTDVQRVFLAHNDLLRGLASKSR